MKQLQQLEATVRSLYEAKDPGRAPIWTDWLGAHHVFVVADYATGLAREHKANAELARAGAILHDIADVNTSQRGPGHAAKSLKMARELMQEAGYNESEIKLVVDDAIRYHSCHGDERPSSIEGKILSTADSLAHLKTDFYLFATWALRDRLTLEEIKQWTLGKLEQDINSKMFFAEVRQDVLPDYDLLKELFSR